MEEYSFEKLNVYIKARQLVADVYHILDMFPNIEKYALCDQIRRSIVSVPSNIAEQSGRVSKKEKAHFIEISYGSLMEAYCQLQIAVDLNYISQEAFDNLKESILVVSKLLSGLRKSFFYSQTNDSSNTKH